VVDPPLVGLGVVARVRDEEVAVPLRESVDDGVVSM
jgi:hypothetical protein